MSNPYVAWGITYQDNLLESTIRMLRNVAIGDYLMDVGMPGADWKQAQEDGCRVVKVWIYTEKQA